MRRQLGRGAAEVEGSGGEAGRGGAAGRRRWDPQAPAREAVRRVGGGAAAGGQSDFFFTFSLFPSFHTKKFR